MARGAHILAFRDELCRPFMTEREFCQGGSGSRSRGLRVRVAVTLELLRGKSSLGVLKNLILFVVGVGEGVWTDCEV